MRALRKSCDACQHYDGRYGEDCCFQCERDIRAIQYERK